MWQPVEGVMEARELTAEDIALDIKQFIDSPWGGRFDGMVTAEGVHASGRYTVVTDFETFSPQYVYYVGLENRACYGPPETIAAGADKWENQGGTGPFMFEEYVIGSHMSYVRNPNYWNKATIDGVKYQMPFVDRLLRPIIPDVSTQIAALRTGELDFHANIPPEQWATLDNIAPKLLKSRYSSSCIMISFDNTKPPFDNVDMRRAMMIGTDLEAISEFALTKDLPAAPWWPILPTTTDAYTLLEELPADIQILYDYNPELAAQMIAEVYPNGLKVDYYCESIPKALDFASLMKDMWAKIGVTTEIKSSDWVTYVQYRETHTFKDVVDHDMELANPLMTIDSLMKMGGWLNYAQYSNERVDELAALIAAEPDHTKQIPWIKEAAQIYMRECGTIPAHLVAGGYYWWPWLKNYYGEMTITDGDFGYIIPYIWIDQDLKADMGY